MLSLLAMVRTVQTLKAVRIVFYMIMLYEPVGVHDCVESVCNSEDGTVLEGCTDSVLYVSVVRTCLSP